MDLLTSWRLGVIRLTRHAARGANPQRSPAYRKRATSRSTTFDRRHSGDQGQGRTRGWTDISRHARACPLQGAKADPGTAWGLLSPERA